MTAAMVGRVGAPPRDGCTRCPKAPQCGCNVLRRIGRIIEIVFPGSHRRPLAGALRVAIAVLSADNPSDAYGAATLRGVAARLLRGLRPAQ